VVSGANYQVQSGGSFTGTVSSVAAFNASSNPAATLTVSSGGTIRDVTVLSNGSIDLLGGAAVTALTLQSGAVESVGAGYVQTNPISGASYHVLNSGKVVGTVSAGALVTVSSGGSLSSVTVASGGFINLFGGASLTAVTLQPGATEVVRSGYIQTGAISGVKYTVWQGGVFSGTVSAGATVMVTGLAPISGTYDSTLRGVLSNVVVASGGTISAPVIISGSSITVLSGGILADAPFRVYGTLVGGSIGTPTAQGGAGELILVSGGSISGATIRTGGRLYLGDGGTIAGVTVNSGGIVSIVSGRTNLSGVAVQSGVCSAVAAIATVPSDH
jgi:autotransporter passenger strand-loop-strand repeat protein